jgi:hypothetical protein
MNFLLFGIYNYYPSGGWTDFIGQYYSKNDAILAAKDFEDKNWFQVVDLSTLSCETFSAKEIRDYEIS